MLTGKRLQYLADLLPENVSWGDPLNAVMLDQILAAHSAGAQVTPFLAPVSIDRTHKNQAFVTYGFASEKDCMQFIKATREGSQSVTQPQPMPQTASAGAAGVPVETAQPWRVVNDSLIGRGLALQRPFVLKRGDMECYCPDGRLKRWKSETEAQRACNRLNTGRADELESLKADNARLLDSLTKESNARCEAEDKLAAMTDAARDVLAERQRQIEVEGFSPTHDSKQTPGDLARAAACYAMHAAGVHTAETHPPSIWPRNWSVKWWKPGVSRRDLVKAGALILAEIERLDRAKGE